MRNYLDFLEGLCDNADPAAAFDFALVCLSRSTADAAEAAPLEVTLLFFDIINTTFLLR